MRVELRSDVEQTVARMLAPRVNRLAERVAEEARLRAPDGKRWVSVGDDRVRPSHRHTHGQLIPDNLRYRLPRIISVLGQADLVRPGYDLGRVPRDAELPAYQRDGCRCGSLPVPGAVARAISVRAAVVEGVRVRARVEVVFPRVAEAEFGTSGDVGARFLGVAVNVVAARLNAAARRT